MTFEIQGENYCDGRFAYSFGVIAKDSWCGVEFEYHGAPIPKDIINSMANGEPFSVDFENPKGIINFKRDDEGELVISCGNFQSGWTLLRVSYEMHAKQIANFANGTLRLAHEKCTTKTEN